MTVIRVESPQRPYDVVVGPIESGLDRIRDLSVFFIDDPEDLLR